MRKQKVECGVTSSTESEYRAMANVTCKLIWVKNLLNKLGFISEYPMRLYCDNHATIHIAENLVLHVRTKHIEMDCHLVRQKTEKIVQARHISSDHQLANLLTRSLGKIQVHFICDKLDIYDNMLQLK